MIDNSELGVIVSNASANLFQRIKHMTPGQRLLLAPFPIMATALLIWLIVTGSGNNVQIVFIGGMLLLSFGGGWLAQLRLASEAAILAQFASDNGYLFDRDGAVDQTYGALFRVTSGGKASDVVTGLYRGHTLRLFAYTLTVQQGRSSHTYQDTVMELEVGGKLPGLLLLNKKSRFGGMNLEFGDDDLGLMTNLNLGNRVVLEGDFNEYFTLFASGNAQIPAREIFTPDLMAILEDSYRQFSIEFVAGRAYIYAPGLLKKGSDLAAIFTLAQKLADILEPLSTRFVGDSTIPDASPNQPTTIEPLGAGLNRKVIWFIVAVGVALPVLFGIAILIVSG